MDRKGTDKELVSFLLTLINYYANIFSQEMGDNMAQIDVDLNSIRLDEIEFYGTPNLKRKLEYEKITTMAEFLYYADRYTGKLVSELRGMAKIYRCKYLHIDPKIDENDRTVLSNEIRGSTDREPIADGVEYMRELLGLSDLAAKQICKHFGTPAELFKAFRDNKIAGFLRMATLVSGKEIIHKVNIVLEFNNEKADAIDAGQILPQSDADSICNELLELSAMQANIYSQLQDVIAQNNAVSEKIRRLTRVLNNRNNNFDNNEQQ